MVNRIFFEGRDAGATPHLWPEAFENAGGPPEFRESAGPYDADVWIVRDRPAVHSLPNGAEAFVPEFYEMNYAYPLIVWLVDPDESADEFERRMAGISPRNCLGLQVPIPPGCRAGRVLDAVRCSVAQLRTTWHVHTERIIPCGAGRLGDAALQAVLSRPEWFGGAIALDATFSQPPVLPIRNQELRGKRVLLAKFASATDGGAEKLQSLTRLLNAAGMDVTSRHYSGYPLEDLSALADVNTWLMEGIAVAV